MIIESVSPDDYAEMLTVWEDSVRATHHFLTESDIEGFKPMILEHAFPAVELRCIKSDENQILGFIGAHDSKIEMLFILANQRGKGLGKMLLRFAVDELGALKVDVNEQNPEATAFYQSQGFKIISRSPLDDMGKPFPILHMELAGQ